MQFIPLLPHLNGTAQMVYSEIKYWLSIGAVVWTIMKIMHWVKKIKETDLVNIQSSVSAVSNEINSGLTTLNAELVKQTSAIVNELKEMRADFRTFYVPGLTMQPARMRAARKKKEPAKETV